MDRHNYLFYGQDGGWVAININPCSHRRSNCLQVMSNILYFYGMCGLVKELLLMRYFSKVSLCFQFFVALILFFLTVLIKIANAITGSSWWCCPSNRITYSSSLQKSKCFSINFCCSCLQFRICCL